jgi:ketosteroid isomerase-like protein
MLISRFQGRRSSAPVSTLAAVPAIVAALLLSACSAAPRGGAEASWREYLETLDRLEAQGVALEPGSAKESRAVERFQNLLSDYTAPDFVARLPEVYSEDVFFNDTLKTLRGVDAVARHFAATAEAVETGTVEFVDLVAEDGDYYFRWVMTVRFKRLDDGAEKLSVGMTHVRFDAAGRVVLHQDFWDSTGGFFEHLPALGWALRRAKARL